MTGIGRVVDGITIGAFALSYIYGRFMAPATGAWELPASAGWTKYGNCPSGTERYGYTSSAGSSTPSATQINLANTCTGGQAITEVPIETPVNTGHRSLTVVSAPNGIDRHVVLEYWHRNPAGAPSSFARAQVPMGFPAAIPLPQYTKVPNVPQAVPDIPGDVGFSLSPSGKVQFHIGQRLNRKPPRGEKETKAGGSRKRMLARVIMRGSDVLSEFYEFNEAAAKAVKMPGRSDATMGDMIKYLWADGHINELDFFEITEIIRMNAFEDSLYGSWSRSVDRATKRMGRFGFDKRVEVGGALDGGTTFGEIRTF